jgi:transposase
MSVTRIDVDVDELRSIIDQGQLEAEARRKLHAAVDTLLLVTHELERKRVSISRLQKLVFGARTEKSASLAGSPAEHGDATAREEGSSASDDDAASTSSDDGADARSSDQTKRKKRRKGHGRNPAAAYAGACCVSVPHESLKPGDVCPSCERGKVYPFKPQLLVRLRGQAPIAATVWQIERLRCNACQQIFAAKTPAGVGDEKYDATATAMVGTLKYCTGMPFHRLTGLQASLEVPLPASTQWRMVNEGEQKLRPAFDELVRQAANGRILHNDDTTAKILSLKQQLLLAHEGDERTGRQRTGIFTTGIVSVLPSEHLVALFFTGRDHAGENLGKLLAERDAGLEPPIHMSDALPVNIPKTELDVIVANCLTHARRNFVDIETRFPEECHHLVEQLGIVYFNDAVAKKRKLSDDERLEWHQQRSGPVMAELKEWIDDLLDNNKVEPNSPLGAALQYMNNHWQALTLFLRVAGAPLDNNICERAFKRAILHRKNALFFRSQRGARVADVFMSLGYSAVLAKANPVAYLAALLEHHERVADNPAAWMPWNYTTALAVVAAPAAA